MAIRQHLITEYLEARQAGNTGRMAYVQGKLRGAELTFLAKQIELQDSDPAPGVPEAVNSETPTPVKPGNKAASAGRQQGEVNPKPSKEEVMKKRKAVTKGGKSKKVEGVAALAEARGDYKVSDVRTPSGAKSLSCGDSVAQAMNGLTREQCLAVAKRAGLGDLTAHYKDLNPGMVRMNIGNRLRAKSDEPKVKEALAYGKDLDREGDKPEPKKATKKATKKASKPKAKRASKPRAKKAEATTEAA